MDSSSSEHLFHLIVGNCRVPLGNQLLVSSEVIKLAVMGLSMTVLGAQNVRALARHLKHADLLAAFPALVRIFLR